MKIKATVLQTGAINKPTKKDLKKGLRYLAVVVEELDDSDIQDILRRAKNSFQQNRKFDIENDLRIYTLNISVGRINSQITKAIPKNETDDFFNLTNTMKSGRASF